MAIDPYSAGGTLLGGQVDPLSAGGTQFGPQIDPYSAGGTPFMPAPVAPAVAQAGLVPHPGVGNGLIPPTRAHSSFIASVLAHLLGAHQGGMVGQMVGGHPQVIHGFGPQGPVIGHPGYHPAPSSAMGLVPAHPSHIVQALLAALHGHQQAAPPSNVNQPI